ncbi:hypothetical protein ACMFMG_006784 [Clarireedia jacksonii]
MSKVSQINHFQHGQDFIKASQDYCVTITVDLIPDPSKETYGRRRWDAGREAKGEQDLVPERFQGGCVWRATLGYYLESLPCRTTEIPGVISRY